MTNDSVPSYIHTVEPLRHGPLELVRGVDLPEAIVGRGQCERGGDPQRLRNFLDLDGREGVALKRPERGRACRSKCAARGCAAGRTYAVPGLPS